jgi:tRNA 5-methylaminomethyl-2-thiouridine biosynthesis bifunctional protein
LARRGWTVTVLDAGPAPAAGASGLPVGLLAPQLSKDDGARARLTRAGVRMTHQWCHALLQQAADWAPCGVRQIQLDATPADALWHPTGAWIKPARLVAACLARPGVQFRGAAQVAQVAHHGDAWLLFDATGTVLARATQLVLAAAGGSVPLLERIQLAGVTGTSPPPRLRAMQLLGGQVSWGLHCAGDAAHFPSGPVNGHGSFVPDVPMDGAHAWFAGATYETEANPGRDPQTGHLENWQRLARLLPTAAQRLTRRFERGEVHAWHGSRCATPDRLPAVGPVHADAMPPIWMSSAMGSRGLTYAVLSAELLAARLGGEPLPVEGRLARLLAATRPGLVMSDHL